MVLYLILHYADALLFLSYQKVFNMLWINSGEVLTSKDECILMAWIVS